MRTRARAALLAVGGAVVLSLPGAVANAAPPPLPPPRRDPPIPPPRRDAPRPQTDEVPPGESVLEIIPAPAPRPPPSAEEPPARWREQHEKFARTLDVSLHVSHRRLQLPATFGPTFGGSAAAVDLRAAGDVGETATTLRAGLSLSGVRFGVGAGIAAVSGLRVERAVRGSERLAAGRAFGTPVEAFLGYAHGRIDGLRPFVELRGSAALVHVAVDRGGAERQSHSALGPSLGGRAGVRLWIDTFLFAEAGIGLGLLGAERFSGGAAIGLPIPLANL